MVFTQTDSCYNRAESILRRGLESHLLVNLLKFSSIFIFFTEKLSNISAGYPADAADEYYNPDYNNDEEYYNDDYPDTNTSNEIFDSTGHKEIINKRNPKFMSQVKIMIR